MILLRKKITLIAYVFWELRTSKDVVKKIYKKPRLRRLLVSQDVKQFWNLHDISFLMLSYHYERNNAGKCLF